MRKLTIYRILVAILFVAVLYLSLRITLLSTHADTLESRVAVSEEKVTHYINEIQSNNNIINNMSNCIDESQSEIDALSDELYIYKNLESIQENHEITEHSYTCHNDRNMLYALYEPNGLDKETDLPLILYLHGSYECGHDLRVLYRAEKSFTKAVYENVICPNAYILMPQLPGGNWLDYAEDLIALIDEISETYNIDKNRISITGHSLGAYGTISILNKYNDIFAAAAPMSSSITSNLYEGLMNIPVWFLVGEYDDSGSYIAADKYINENGGNSKITVYEGEGHTIPYHYTDNNNEIVKWLISFSKI